MRDQSPATTVSVVIPTLDRPAPLLRAIASVMAQKLPLDVGVDLIVVDNSKDGSACRGVCGLKGTERIALRYLPVPRPGIATARNAGVEAATGDWIAFLDDDEEAGTTWIAALLAVAASSGADAVFGPVGARAEDAAEIGPLGRFFSRRIEDHHGADITRSAADLGTANSMFSRRACRAVEGPFDERLDGVGGEDTLFLKRLVSKGCRFAWARDAAITEWVPAQRLTWAYVNKRKFLSGQIRTSVNRMVDEPGWWPVLLWMAVGAVQCCLAGAGAAALWLVSNGTARRLQAMAYGGLGKVLWTSRFRPGFYGSGLAS